MNKLRPILLVLTAVAALSVAYPARANFIETITQVGTDVVATGSGSVNLAGLTFDHIALTNSGIGPQSGIIQTGPHHSLTDVYFGVTGPKHFGNGDILISSTGSGDFFGTQPGILLVPEGYLSGNFLSDSMTFNNSTVTSLGLRPGTYVWTWGDGGANQNFTLIIGGVVPDGGSTICLLGCALLGLVGLRRRLGC